MPSLSSLLPSTQVADGHKHSCQARPPGWTWTLRSFPFNIDWRLEQLQPNLEPTQKTSNPGLQSQAHQACPVDPNRIESTLEPSSRFPTETRIAPAPTPGTTTPCDTNSFAPPAAFPTAPAPAHHWCPPAYQPAPACLPYLPRTSLPCGTARQGRRSITHSTHLFVFSSASRPETPPPSTISSSASYL